MADLMLMTVQTRRRNHDLAIQLITNTGIIHNTESNMLLGAKVDQDLKWSHHIFDLVKSLNSRLLGLKNVCKYSDFKT